MTYEEALYYHTHNGATIEEEMEAEFLIKEAVEKQIPKKPIQYSGFNSKQCPSCGQEFGFNSGFRFCENCGQALYWGND